MSVSEKTSVTTASRSPARRPTRRPPNRPNASGMLKKVLGIVLLVSTVGLASCQAMWSEALITGLPFGLWN